MAKIRHIAYRATDVDAMAKFFVDAMGMKCRRCGHDDEEADDVRQCHSGPGVDHDRLETPAR